MDFYIPRIMQALEDGPAMSDEIRSEVKMKQAGMRDLMVRLCRDGKVMHRKFRALNFEQTGGKMVDMWMLPDHAKYFGGCEYKGEA